jgi:adenylosuccinate synthase
MINLADVVFGLAWGDESKGKIVAELSSRVKHNGESYYDFVARWAGGSNAGHTVYVNGDKYKTHIIPSGVFHGVKSVVGPGCVLHPESFMEEIEYLDASGFDVNLIKVHPNCHIVTDEHIRLDKENLADLLGTTAKGIAPCYADKAARVGRLAKDYLSEHFILREPLYGNILCEGAQGAWLDINHGLYPYVTSSETFPYAACSIGFAPQKINDVWGAAKIYDTRSGEDPRFPKSLLDDQTLYELGDLGEEYGVTTGRRRKVNWLNLNMLIESINISGTTHIVISKCDVIDELSIYRLFYDDGLVRFFNLHSMKEFIQEKVEAKCPMARKIIFSSSPESI